MNGADDSETARRRPWPESLADAVEMLRAHVPLAEQQRIAKLRRDALLELHFDLGAWIRCSFGLTTGNDELLDATGGGDPADACDAIIEAFWHALREDALHSAGRQGCPRGGGSV